MNFFNLVVLGFAFLMAGCGCRLDSSWSTALDFGLATSQDSALFAVATDSKARIFVAGRANDVGPTTQWIVRRSLDGGTNWATVDNTGSTTVLDGSGAYSLAVANNDVIYAAGTIQLASSPRKLTIRRSTDYGSTWSTVLSEDLNGYSVTTIPRHLFVDSLNRIWWIGSLTAGMGVPGWRVMRSSDGTTWSTVASRSAADTSYSGTSLFENSATGTFYLTQTRQRVGIGTLWELLKSTDDGATWTTVESYSYTSANLTVLSGGLFNSKYSKIMTWGAGEAATGGIVHWLARLSSTSSFTQFANADATLIAATDSRAEAQSGDAMSDFAAVTGNSTDSALKTHWITRVSTDGGSRWAASDNFQFQSDKNAKGRDIRFDVQGNAWAAGEATNSASVTCGIVRKLSCR